ncbi:DUF6247 family protein [Sphaerimonospora cavernae]|uniref:DUF6247 family protein n=1 Tax=Sphaerimonospora cavernae TaxID=1740611 RepID=A0ABV6U1S7_9ACTN
MTAQPVEYHDPGHDPDDIVSRLPEQYRSQFLAEYREALSAAAEPWRYRQLQKVLHLWHLRALMYADPGHEQAKHEAAQGINCVPAEDVIPGWAELVAARQAGRAE